MHTQGCTAVACLSADHSRHLKGNLSPWAVRLVPTALQRLSTRVLDSSHPASLCLASFGGGFVVYAWTRVCVFVHKCVEAMGQCHMSPFVFSILCLEPRVHRLGKTS